MPINLSIPLTGENKTVKDHVISILSSQWPLSSRKIYNILTKKYNLAVSYQAVHKAIKELLESNIIVRDSKELKLNLDWINEVKGFGERIGEMYENGNNITISMERIFEKDVSNFTFNTVFEFYRFMLNLFEDYLLETIKNGISISYLDHMWWTLIGSEKEQNQFKNFISNVKEGYTICKGNTYADRMLAEFYKNFGPNVKIKLGVNFLSDCDKVIMGDFIIHVYLPDDIKQQFHSTYNKMEGFSGIDFKNFYNSILNKKTEINVVIFKNPKLAEQLREDTLRLLRRSDLIEAKSSSKNHPQAMVFNSIHDVDSFILKFITDNNSNKKNKKQDLFLYWINSWVPLFIEKETYKKIVEVVRNYNIHSVIKNKTPIDLWCKKIVEKSIKDRIGIDLEMPDTLILNNMVLQVFYPDQIKKEICDTFSKTSDINELDIDKLFHTIFEKKTTIPVVIHKDKKMAEQLKSKIMGYF